MTTDGGREWAVAELQHRLQRPDAFETSIAAIEREVGLPVSGSSDQLVARLARIGEAIIRQAGAKNSPLRGITAQDIGSILAPCPRDTTRPAIP